MLQAKKVRGVQAAFKLFNRIMRVPGKGELTMVELRVRPCLLLTTTRRDLLSCSGTGGKVLVVAESRLLCFEVMNQACERGPS